MQDEERTVQLVESIEPPRHLHEQVGGERLHHFDRSIPGVRVPGELQRTERSVEMDQENPV